MRPIFSVFCFCVGKWGKYCEKVALGSNGFCFAALRYSDWWNCSHATNHKVTWLWRPMAKQCRLAEATTVTSRLALVLIGAMWQRSRNQQCSSDRRRRKVVSLNISETVSSFISSAAACFLALFAFTIIERRGSYWTLVWNNVNLRIYWVRTPLFYWSHFVVLETQDV